MAEKKRTLGYLIAAAILALVVMYSEKIFQMVGNFGHIMLPLVGGTVLAYILNLITVRLEAVFFPQSKNRFINRMRPFVCILMSIILVAVVVMVIVNLVVPEVVNALSMLGTNIPVYLNQLVVRLDEIQDNYLVRDWLAGLLNDNGDIREQFFQFVTKEASGMISSLSMVVGSLGSAVFGFFVAFSFAIYILAGRKQLVNQVRMIGRAFIPELWSRRIGIVLRTADETFSSFIVGQVTEAVILGGLCMIGMSILKIPYVTAVGVFIGATALIPVFGAWIGAGIGALLILAVNPWKAVLFLVFIVILQQTENNLIYPRIVGTSIGLPGIWVLAAITVGAGLGGIAGMFISVPLTATGYKLFRMLVRDRLEKRSKEGIKKH